MSEITIAELVRNGTMSADMAALLWAAVDERLSFLTVALPRHAGKTTTSDAALALRPPEVPLYRVAGEPDVMEQLRQKGGPGYLVVAEFSMIDQPGYIWGEPVQRVFDTLPAGFAVQTSLHATGVEEGILAVTRGNGISDEQASAFKLVIYIEVFGDTWDDVKRRVVNLYEVHKIENGRPVGHPLHVWHAAGDRFEKVTDPYQFGRDRDDLERRAHIMGGLATAGRTSEADEAQAVQEYRAAKRAGRPV